MSRRTEKIASVIRTVVADAIQRRLSDPRIEPFTSITHIEVAPDLSCAHVNVSVMARPARQKLCVEALQSAAGKLRGMLGRQLSTRIVPELRFHLDESLQRSMETIRLIDEIVEREGLAAPPADDNADDHDPRDSAADESTDHAGRNRQR